MVGVSRVAARPVPWSALLAGLALTLPLAACLWLVATPQANRAVVLPREHLLIVTLVSLLAAIVAVLVARAALRLEQFQVLLITLGFVGVAGFFMVHALATPGSMPHGTGGYDELPDGPAGAYDYRGTVIGLSASLSLFVPAFFFAASYPPLALGLKRRLPIPPWGLALAVGVALAAYGALAAWQPGLLAGLPPSRPPLSHALAATAIALLVFAGWHQARAARRSRLPMHGAMAVAFLLLAEAQVVMALAPFWTLAWWGYHALMLAAVGLALGALVVELDRRRGLERFLPAEVVERVVAGDLLRLGGERRAVTVLFADLRGSTTLAEGLPAEAVVEVLNTYVGALGRCVFEHGGMLDKFLGDGLMAIFGVLEDGSAGAAPAARAALSMRAALRTLSAERAGRGEVAMRCGVGLHTGEVVLGVIGLPQRLDFTAIGDTVNTAARLEGLCKEFAVDVVLSAQTVARLPAGEFDACRLGTTPIRGRNEPIEVFTLA